MAERFIDFDAARAERAAEPIVLKAYGRTFELPPSMSAAVMLDVMRMQADRDDASEVTLEDALRLFRRMLPEDVLDELLAEDFSLDDFFTLLQMVMAVYMRTPQGEASAPNRETRRRAEPAAPSRKRGSRASSSDRPTSTSGPTSSNGGS